MTAQQHLKSFLSNRTNLILISILLIIVIAAAVFIPKILIKPDVSKVTLQDVDLNFDPDGPYAILEPRNDGNAVNLIIKRIASYEAFSYQLVYESEGVDRGAGDPNTYVTLKDKKTEYKQEVLFGTCSQGYTSGGAHCVFDKGVENGTLTLRFKKGTLAYKMLITWHLQKPAVALGVITSGDGHLTYKTEASRQELANVAYSVVNDLSGAPKLIEGKQFVGKVYMMSVPTAKTFPAGNVSIETAEAPSIDMQIAWFSNSKNSWELAETKVSGSSLNAKVPSNGIFAVVKAFK